MKTTLFVILIISSVFAAVSNPKAGETVCVQVSGSLNLRKDPCGSIVGSASNGQSFTLDGGIMTTTQSNCKHKWLGLKYNGGRAWAADGFLVRCSSSPASKTGAVNYNGKVVSDGALKSKLAQIAGVLGTIAITSGDRSYVPKGGSQTSLHLSRRAADFYPTNGTPLSTAFNKLRSSGLFPNDYEIIWHGPYTCTGGPHLHVGRFGNGRATEFKIEGDSKATSCKYRRV